MATSYNNDFRALNPFDSSGYIDDNTQLISYKVVEHALLIVVVLLFSSLDIIDNYFYQGIEAILHLLY